jgi:hypothetical protein
MDTKASFAYPHPSMTVDSSAEHNDRDAAHVKSICALQPELDARLGLYEHSALLPDRSREGAQQLLSAHLTWRSAVQHEAGADKERQLDARVLAASIELLQFQTNHHADLPHDPDVITPIAWLLLAQLRGMLPGAANERFRGLVARLSALPGHLKAQSVAPAADELSARAVDVIDGLPDLLRAITDAARNAKDLPAALRTDVERAVDQAAVACDAHRRRLADAPHHDFSPIGANMLDELLRLRGLDLDHHEVIDICRVLAEECLVERARLVRRRGKDTRADGEHCPQHRSEAMQWLRELVERGRSFFTEQGGIPVFQNHGDQGPERLHVDAMPACFAPQGQRTMYIPPQQHAPRRDALLLLREPLGSQVEALAELSVFDLELLQTAVAFPGRHTAEVWWQRLVSLARRGAAAPMGSIAATWGTDLVEGAALFGIEVAREVGFRPSTMARIVAVEHSHRAALLGIVDVALCTGRMTPAAAASFLVRRGGLRLPTARAQVRGLMSQPTSGLSAIIGKVRIDQLRREAYKRWRGTFSLRRFSTLLVANGPVPLAYLFERLDEPAQYLNQVPTMPG